MPGLRKNGRLVYILLMGYDIIPEHEISRQSTGRTTALSPANTLAGDSQQAAQLSPRAATPAVCRATERTAYGTLVLYSHKRSANISCSGKATVKREDGPQGSSRPQRLICSTRRPYIPSAVPADRSRIADT